MSQYWIRFQDGQESGPYSATNLRTMIASGHIKRDCLIRRLGEGEPWRAVSDIAGVKFPDHAPRDATQGGGPVPAPPPSASVAPPIRPRVVSATNPSATARSSPKSPQDPAVGHGYRVHPQQEGAFSDTHATEWYCTIDNRQIGPMTWQQLAERAARGEVKADTLVWRTGLPQWVPASSVANLLPQWLLGDSLVGSVSRKVAQLTHTEVVDQGHFKDLFREVGQRHTSEDTEAVFAVGLATTTPALAAMSTSLPAPWVFTRLLSFLGLAFLAMWLGWKQWNNFNLLPGIILLGSFTAPLGAAVFLFECNAPKNISLFAVVRLFVWGGILGLLVSLLLFNMTENFGERIGPPIAGLVEEPAKLLAVIVLGSLPRYRWTLNGMCLGAAVGAGFAAFESAGYAMNVLLATKDPDAMFTNIVQRGVLSPLGHVVWTCIAAGAVWRVKGDKPFAFDMLKDRRCFAPILAVMALHATWNSQLPGLLPFFLGYLVLGGIAWTIAIGMLLGAMREIRATGGVRIE